MKVNQYQEFLKSLKIALTNSSVYFSGHPVFSQAIENFKNKSKFFFDSQENLIIQVKPNSLVVNGKVLEKENICRELAFSLHRKKIKSVTIKGSATAKELSDFFTVLAANSDAIKAKGGISRALKEKVPLNIEISELDYSQLLNGSGSQVKDIWAYLFSLGGSTQANYQAFAKKFKKAADIQGVEEILNDSRLCAKLMELFQELKVKNEKDFKEVLEKLGISILKSKNISAAGSKDKLRELFSQFGPKDLAGLLLNFFESEAQLSKEGFNLFTLLFDSETHQKSAEILQEKIKQGSLKSRVDKIKNILAPLGQAGVVPVYRRYLAGGGPGEDAGKFKFDQNHLEINYRLCLLDLFFYETNSDRLKLILEIIFSKITSEFNEKGSYFKKFIQVYCKKSQTFEPRQLSCLSQKIWPEIEKNIFNPAGCEFAAGLKEVLDKSTLSPDYYLNKIEGGEFNFFTIELFFKFFPGEIQRLKEKITAKKNQFSFLRKILNYMVKIKHQETFEILKEIYTQSPVFMKIEILDTIRGSLNCNLEFILPVIKSGNFYLRQKAVEVASVSGFGRQAAEALFSLPAWNFNSRVILENLEMLKSISLPEAEFFLKKLSRKKFFWNRKLRKKALEILEKYG